MDFMMHLALAAAGKSPWTGLFGALHPGIVHFPIALLAVGAFLEAIQILRKKPEAAPGTAILAYLAAASAVPACFFGFQLAEYGGNEGDLINLHKWFGLGTALIALIAAAGAFKSKASPAWLRTMRVGLLAGACSVLITGYLGGELGSEGHITKHLRAILGMNAAHAEETKDGKVSDSTPPDKKDPLLTPTAPASDKVDFVKEIAPIIKDDCFKCHGGEKVKGKFNLGSKKTAFDQAESGKAILPGKPAELSKFYKSMTLGKDDDDLMPPVKEKARPTKDQIERVKKWIEQGAEWPDGYEFKK